MKTSMKIGAVMTSILLVASPILARQRGSTPKPKPTASPAVAPKPVPPETPVPQVVVPANPPEPTLESKLIHYSEKEVVKLKTKLRYTTLIILPKSEKILDYSCGDREFWVVEGTENFAYVKPAKASAQTNLNLITASGNVYSFSLVEISDIPNAQPDLKVFVDLKDESMLGAVSGPQRFASAAEIEKYRIEAAVAREETRRVKEITDETIEKGIGKILSKFRCGYKFKKNKKPFYVSTICHDDKFTYLSMAPEETPTLYNLREGENLVNFNYKPTAPLSVEDSRPNSGILTVQKIVQRGYIAIGKERLHFSIEE